MELLIAAIVFNIIFQPIALISCRVEKDLKSLGYETMYWPAGLISFFGIATLISGLYSLL